MKRPHCILCNHAHYTWESHRDAMVPATNARAVKMTELKPPKEEKFATAIDVEKAVRQRMRISEAAASRVGVDCPWCHGTGKYPGPKSDAERMRRYRARRKLREG